MAEKISAGGVKKGRNEGDKVVTANVLLDGRVVYRSADGQWADDLFAAEVVRGDEAIAALEAALSDEGTVVGPYLMDVDLTAQGAVPSGRGRLREEIRLIGPTIHPQFARQAPASSRAA